ncbi:winged helix-turn-helix domain-containing protein [Metapseudomonas resinovorans]|uniref:winged helix-turn-helix domain-containing protein n=1 Tax=Metapseudomonas resinovorans TaxID=53412 RepID=UPI001E2ECC7F|nr:winged helix-turn-helix domain-containing protein [Pseudomonas resinovorans]
MKSGVQVLFDAANNQLQLDSGAGEVRSVTLSYSESRLLQLLLERPGETRSRNEIMEFAWDNRVVAAGSLNQAIFTLRNLIEDGTDHDLLQTVPRRGYRFNANYLVDAEAVVPESAATPVESPVAEVPVMDAAPASRLTRALRSPALLLAAYAAMTCLLALVAAYRFGLFDGAGAELVIDDVQAGSLHYHFVGDSIEENARNRETFKAALAVREEGPGGQVWVNRSNRLFDISCVRADGSTQNMVYLENAPLADLHLEMVRRCMRSLP